MNFLFVNIYGCIYQQYEEHSDNNLQQLFHSVQSTTSIKARKDFGVQILDEHTHSSSRHLPQPLNTYASEVSQKLIYPKKSSHQDHLSQIKLYSSARKILKEKLQVMAILSQKERMRESLYTLNNIISRRLIKWNDGLHIRFIQRMPNVKRQIFTTLQQASQRKMQMVDDFIQIRREKKIWRILNLEKLCD